jgi:hypothetical protein
MLSVVRIIADFGVARYGLDFAVRLRDASSSVFCAAQFKKSNWINLQKINPTCGHFLRLLANFFES